VLTAEIDRPRMLPGEFIWQGRSFPLRGEHTKLRLDAGHKKTAP